jgi:mannosyltransferase
MPQGDISRGRAFAVVAGLMLLALALRLIGISRESAWWDEYSSLVHLNAPSLWAFLRDNRTYDPATLPLYYAIEYLWSRAAGTATVVMRVPSLVMGIAIVPAVHALGARLFSRRAGLIAAACVAASPMHAFHAQGIRMYVLFTLLAVLSMHTFALVWGEGRGWKRHAIVQLLLSWTHPFALLIPAVQGAAMAAASLLRRRHSTPSTVKPFAQMLRWGGLTGLAWLPALAYLSTVRYYPADVVTWLEIPSIPHLLYDLFADDVVAWDYALYQSARAWEWFPVMRTLRPAFDIAFAITLLGAAAMGAMAAWRRAAGRRALLLLFWAVLPVLALYAASVLIRPMHAPRYTVHASIAIYLLAGAGIAALPRIPRNAAAALLILLMLYQTSLLHPGPQRADYLGAADIIETHATPGEDIVLVTSQFEFNTFRYNYPAPSVPVLHLEGLPLAYLTADALLRQHEAPRPMQVWIVHVIPYFPKYPELFPHDTLPGLGLHFEQFNLPAIQTVYVLRVTVGDAPAGYAAMRQELNTLVNGYMPEGWQIGLLAPWSQEGGPAAAHLARAACSIAQLTPSPAHLLYCGVEVPISHQRARALNAFTTMPDAPDAATALAQLRQLLEIDPRLGVAQVLVAAQHAAMGDAAAAMEAFRAAREDPAVEAVLAGYIDALERRDVAGAVEAANVLAGGEGEQTLAALAQRLGEVWQRAPSAQ